MFLFDLFFILEVVKVIEYLSLLLFFGLVWIEGVVVCVCDWLLVC